MNEEGMIIMMMMMFEQGDPEVVVHVCVCTISKKLGSISLS